MPMNRIAISVLWLSLAAPVPATAATLFHVRTDGSDTGCTGKADAPYPGSGTRQPCAFATPQKAADTMSDSAGDDIMIHAGTYNGRLKLKPRIRPRAGESSVIEGDPAVPREQVWIDCDNAVDRECFLVPGGQNSGAASATGIVVRHMRISAGRCNAIRFEGFHEKVRLEDVLFDDMPALCCVLADKKCQPDRMRASVIRFDQGYGNLIDNFVILGNRNTTRYGLAGTDAMSIFLGSYASVVQNGRSERLLGAFVQENGDRNIVQDNFVHTTTCEGDDGCVQAYNDSEMIVRRNIFANVAPDPGDWIITMRMTPKGEGNCSPTGVTAYNNTVIGVDGYPPNARKSAFLIHPNRSPCAYGPTVFLNNIFMKFGSADDRDAAITLFGCPPELTIDNNLFFDNTGRRMKGLMGVTADLNNAASCAGPFNAHSKFGVDPLLDPLTYVPAAASPACAGGNTAFKAWDGGSPSAFIGARPCTSQPPAGRGSPP